MVHRHFPAIDIIECPEPQKRGPRLIRGLISPVGMCYVVTAEQKTSLRWIIPTCIVLKPPDRVTAGP